MNRQEQLAALVCASEELNGYVSCLTYTCSITEEEAEGFDHIIDKIDEVAEAIRTKETVSYIYIVWEDWDGIIGYHKTFEGAKEQLMKDRGYEELVKNYPTPDYNDGTRWGWEVLYIERVMLGE